ncbi:MAG: chromosome segregation protein SMC [Armatimonadetes bacterium]|nr:chromosome segregation protein SMC [Armatimonadota bacterium]
MYLRKLELFGFKTFADRTEIEFGSGITAIVGPNGSGKSNIADAIRWVLGEQSARTLRGNRMEDVIFAGTDARKSLSLCEVTLVLDNSEATLPLDFSEVSVSRRVVRSGEAEYLINKTPCRMRDIHELFMGTGIGVDSFALIGQGEIDLILSADPRDRRLILEETAGVSKYRFRKREALKKLEQTGQNLVRVQDILTEVEARIGPLFEQKEKALRFLHATRELRELEVQLLSVEWDKTKVRHEEYKGKVLALEAEIQKQKETNLALEKDRDALKGMESSRQAEWNQAQEEVADCRVAQEREVLADAQLAKDEEMGRERIRTLDQEIADLELRAQDLARAVAEEEDSLAVVGSEMQALAQGQKTLAEENRDRMKELADITEIIEARKSTYDEAREERASLETRLDHIKVQEQDLLARLARVEVDSDSLDEETADIQQRTAEGKAELEDLWRRIQDAKERSQQLTRSRREKGELRKSVVSQWEALHYDLKEKKSRRAILSDLDQQQEGYNEGVRAILKKGAEFGGILGTLGDLLHVPEPFERPIEIALGHYVQSIVLKEGEAARDAIQYLRQKKAGRATFLPLNHMRPPDPRLSDDLREAPGFRGLAADFVTCDPRCREIVESLLSAVAVFDDLPAAISASRKAPAGDRRMYVTLEGDLLTPDGAVTGGEGRTQRKSLLGRKRILDTLKAEIQKMEEELLLVLQSKTDLETEVNLLDEEFRRVAQDLTDAQLKEREITSRCRHLEEREERLKRDKNRTLEEIARCKEELCSAQDSRTKAQMRLEKLNIWLGSEETRGDETGQDLAERRAALTEIQKRETEVQVSLAALKEKCESTTRRLSALKEDGAALVEQGKARGLILAESRDSLAKAIKERAESGVRLNRLKLELAACMERGDTLSETRKTIAAESEQIEKSLAEIRSRLEELLSAREAWKIKETEASARIAELSDRLEREFGLSFDQSGKSLKENETAGASRRVRQLRQEIQELGPVNLSAVSDYEKLDDRHRFLTSQCRDLQESLDALREIISDIDETTRKQFGQTFEQVRERFGQMFCRLFGGGRADLRLSDPQDLLETGVEIAACPPGKRMQNLNLLSGGEKALTAIAFLMALLSVRPSPFCVLDEIDAPLDDANVERYIQILKEFSLHSQFILITHNRRSMEEAEVLYGATMEEAGVSRLLSVRLADAKALAGSQP